MEKFEKYDYLIEYYVNVVSKMLKREILYIIIWWYFSCENNFSLVVYRLYCIENNWIKYLF